MKINPEKVLDTTISGTSSVFISVALTCKIIPNRVLTIPKLVGPLSMAAPASTITAANKDETGSRQYSTVGGKEPYADLQT